MPGRASCQEIDPLCIVKAGLMMAKLAMKRLATTLNIYLSHCSFLRFPFRLLLPLCVKKQKDTETERDRAQTREESQAREEEGRKKIRIGPKISPHSLSGFPLSHEEEVATWSKHAVSPWRTTLGVAILQQTSRKNLDGSIRKG